MTSVLAFSFLFPLLQLDLPLLSKHTLASLPFMQTEFPKLGTPDVLRQQLPETLAVNHASQGL